MLVPIRPPCFFVKHTQNNLRLRNEGAFQFYINFICGTQSAIRRAFAWKKGNEIHTAVTRRRDREYH